MRYETATSIKGWVALLVIGIGSLACISAFGAGHTLQDCAVASLILFVGFGIGISWLRGRKHVRKIQHHARMLRKGLSRMRSQGSSPRRDVANVGA